MSYKPRIAKRNGFWLTDAGQERLPMSIADARLRRLAIRWCSQKNVEWVDRVFAKSA